MSMAGIWSRLVYIFRTEGQLWALVILGSLAAARGGVQLLVGPPAYHPGYLVVVGQYGGVSVGAALMLAAGIGQLGSAITGSWTWARISTTLAFVVWGFTSLMYMSVPHPQVGLVALAATHGVLMVVAGLLYLRLGRLR